MKRSNLNGRGMTLVEIMISLGVFVLLAATVGLSLSTSIRGDGESNRLHKATVALQSRLAGIQEQANANQAGLYDNLVDTPTVSVLDASINIQDLPGPGGDGAARITTTVWNDESGLPAELGSTKDLNMDGDPDDTPPGFDLKILPMRMRIEWYEGRQSDGTPLLRTIESYHFVARLAG